MDHEDPIVALCARVLTHAAFNKVCADRKWSETRAHVIAIFGEEVEAKAAAIILGKPLPPA